MDDTPKNRYDKCILSIGYQEYQRILYLFRGNFGKLDYEPKKFYGSWRFEPRAPNIDALNGDWDDFNKLLLRLMPNVQDKTMIRTNKDGTSNYAYELFNEQLPRRILVRIS